MEVKGMLSMYNSFIIISTRLGELKLNRLAYTANDQLKR